MNRQDYIILLTDVNTHEVFWVAGIEDLLNYCTSEDYYTSAKKPVVRKQDVRVRVFCGEPVSLYRDINKDVGPYKPQEVFKLKVSGRLQA